MYKMYVRTSGQVTSDVDASARAAPIRARCWRAPRAAMAAMVRLVGVVFALCGFSAATAASAWLESPEPAVHTVHVINSCHLDIGFADTAQNIVNDYFDHHLPLAAAVGQELRANATYGNTTYTDNKLNFMFHSWIMDVFFSCPPGMGLHCPSAQSKANVTAAIAAGDITWQAFPHNAEPAIMDPALIRAGLAMTHALDDRFGQPRKGVLSQRDVPGLTRALIPILASGGVSGISIGAHEDTKHKADVPPCFVWRDPASNQSVIVLYTTGYGSLPVKNEQVCIVDGVALVYNWDGDNHGPSDASGYAGVWQSLGQSFPNATHIYASTLDNFTQYLQTVESSLLTVDQEIADDWIYGQWAHTHTHTHTHTEAHTRAHI